jgi:hypothetical protein
VLLVPSLALAGEFSWGEVPRTRRVVPVHGVLEAAGVPIQAWEVVSDASVDELVRHFARRFEEAGLYVPPAADQARMRNAIQLSAVDPERGVTYTVMLRPTNAGTTKLILGQADFGARRELGGEGVAPVLPGAKFVVTSNVEQARMVAYQTSASEAEVTAFYRDTLTRAGYREEEKGVFRRESEELSVFTRVAQSGARQVVVMAQRR